MNRLVVVVVFALVCLPLVAAVGPVGLGATVGRSCSVGPCENDAAAPPTISYANGSGTENSAFSLSPTTTGATSYSLTAGSLPAGLSLNASTGEISGTPTLSTTASGLQVTATGAGGSTQSAAFSITVECRDVPGAPLWSYAARRETSYANNDPVGTLNDWGSKNDDATAAGAARPTYKTGGPNGKSYLSLDGGDYLDGALTAQNVAVPFWACALYNVGAAATSTETAYSETASLNHLLRNTNTQLQCHFGSVLAGSAPQANKWHLLCCESTTTTSDNIVIDGAVYATATMGTNDVDSVRIGASSVPDGYLLGGLAELHIGSGALPATIDDYATGCYGALPVTGTP